MNAERLNAICKSLEGDFEKTKLLNRLKATVSSLREVVNQSNLGSQNQLAASLKDLYSGLEQSAFNHYSPSWRQIVLELRGDIALGNDLKNTIVGILAENTITLSVALEKIESINKSLVDFKDAVSGISKGSNALGIGCEELEQGACEVGILIPRRYLHDKLDEFMAELREINIILLTFTEYTTGKKHPLEIRAVSFSDLLIYLSLFPPTAACLAKAVSWIVETYEKILQIRKIKLELKNMGLPEKSIAGITEHSNHVMKDEIEKIVVELEKEYCVINESGRRNEIQNGIRISLNKVANRIDKGFNVEVRMALVEHKEDAVDSKKANELEALTKHYNEIQKASQMLQFRRLEGESLLSLPESEKTKEK
ncbi:MAG: hypothetical protein ABSB78_13020 [Bacteroidota bacterium]